MPRSSSRRSLQCSLSWAVAQRLKQRFDIGARRLCRPGGLHHGSMSVNLNLAPDVPQCLFCKGEGTFSPFDDAGQNDTQKLFE